MSKHTETQLRCGYNSVMPDTVYIETAEGDEIGILEHEDAQECGGKLVSRYNNHDALVEALENQTRAFRRASTMLLKVRDSLQDVYVTDYVNSVEMIRKSCEDSQQVLAKVKEVTE